MTNDGIHLSDIEARQARHTIEVLAGRLALLRADLERLALEVDHLSAILGRHAQ